MRCVGGKMYLKRGSVPTKFSFSLEEKPERKAPVYQEMLALKGVKVNVPPFMNQSGQFTEQEMLATRRIATLRIHVERAIEVNV